jgi:hypothetical protein
MAMELSLSVEQFRKLIELAYLGEWILNAHHIDDHQDEDATQLFQQLLLSVDVEGVETDAETGRKYLIADWDTMLQEQKISDYDDHTFWEELTERLAERDLAKRTGQRVEDIDRDDDLLELKPIEDRYRHEFEEHGLDRLQIQSDY